MSKIIGSTKHLLKTILSKLSGIFIDLKHPSLRIYPGIAGQGLNCPVLHTDKPMTYFVDTNGRLMSVLVLVLLTL